MSVPKICRLLICNVYANHCLTLPLGNACMEVDGCQVTNIIWSAHAQHLGMFSWPVVAGSIGFVINRPSVGLDVCSVYSLRVFVCRFRLLVGRNTTAVLIMWRSIG